MDIAATDAAGFYLDEDIVGGKFGRGDIAKMKATNFFKNKCFHMLKDNL